MSDHEITAIELDAAWQRREDALKARIAALESQRAQAAALLNAGAERIKALEAALRGLLDAFETDEIDDFTAYEEPIPSAIHAARAVLAGEPK